MPRIRSLMPTESRVRGGRLAAELHLQAVEDQPVLDLLRLPHIGVEEPVDLLDVGKEHEELENVAVDLEFDPREVVDDVPVLRRDGARVSDVPVDRVERDGWVELPQPLHVLEDALLRDLLRHAATSPSR